MRRVGIVPWSSRQIYFRPGLGSILSYRESVRIPDLATVHSGFPDPALSQITGRIDGSCDPSIPDGASLELRNTCTGCCLIFGSEALSGSRRSD